MSLAGTLMTPRIDSKIRRKLLESRFKRNDFKDILRERFKTRIRANRYSLIQKMRSHKSSDAVQNTLSDYLIHEIDEFKESECRNKSNESPMEELYENDYKDDSHYEHELDILKEIQSELLEEQLSWILEQYAKEEEEIQAMMTELLVCPICRRGVLQKSCERDPVTCTVCNLHLASSITLEQLGATIRQNFDDHSAKCNSDPQFTVIKEPNSNVLCFICNDCFLFNALN